MKKNCWSTFDTRDWRWRWEEVMSFQRYSMQRSDGGSNERDPGVLLLMCMCRNIWRVVGSKFKQCVPWILSIQARRFLRSTREQEITRVLRRDQTVITCASTLTRWLGGCASGQTMKALLHYRLHCQNRLVWSPTNKERYCIVRQPKVVSEPGKIIRSSIQPYL